MSSSVARIDRDVEWDPYPSQERFANSMAKYVGFSGPVGTGKSSALAMRSIRLAYENGGLPGVVTAPTYRMLADVTGASIIETCIEKEIPHYHHKSDNNLILLEPMSTIRFRSTDDPLKLVGSNIAWFGMDELTYTKEDAWRRLEARLRHPKATRLSGFGVWTPNGHDWVYRRFIDQKRRIKTYDVIRAQPGENKAILANNPDYYGHMQLSYDDAFYRQEALGEYVGSGGAKPYYNFDASLDVDKVAYDPRYPLIWSLDFNVDPMCSVIGQRIPGNPSTLNILQEVFLRQANTRQATEQFIRQTIPYTRTRRSNAEPVTVEVYGDSTGKARDTTGELESDWDIVFSNFRQYPEFRAVNCVTNNPPERSRIVSVNSALLNAAGMRRVTIDPACEQLVKDFEDCKWATDSNGKALNYVDETDKMRGHMSSAFGYLVWGAMRILQSVGPASGR